MAKGHAPQRDGRSGRFHSLGARGGGTKPDQRFRQVHSDQTTHEPGEILSAYCYHAQISGVFHVMGGSRIGGTQKIVGL